ncbi:PKD domain-containing protein [Chitinophaga flava]|uniref:PKD domain-containing protein n=1 Tax=Chitinophaga flava TaxID=2259036 RepID=A0A365XSX0_9BACT|nr:PKD domain-containing protein [Chitinophaga flava]RBL89433.1 PKD domain-containing protein [Chitinophaga flava]
MNRKNKRIRLYAILLLAELLGGCYKEEQYPVKAVFSIQVENNNYSVPVQVNISNNTTGAETFSWSFEGGNPATSAKKDPGTIVYNNPGNYILKLIAGNRYGGIDSMTIPIKVDADVEPGFTCTNAQSWFPPVTCQLNNITKGADRYEWTFEGGEPASSTQMQPGNVVFRQPGKHKITLKAGNGRVSFTRDTTITVLPDLVADFSIAWPASNDDKQVPFNVITVNKCISATSYNWSFTGGAPAISTDQAPSVLYNTPGIYTLSLTAANDKKSVVATKTITVLPNTHLYTFTDIRLGINTAQNTIGSYFSSVLGKVLKSGEVTAANGSQIDFCYFGLNNGFNYNKIISPDSVQLYTFSAIPNAINIQVINKQESCGCGVNFSVADFDSMTDDTPLRMLNISQSIAGLAEFDNTVPRVVLFKTSDGRKGAVKIKQFVNAGQQSYILCDIKITKP